MDAHRRLTVFVLLALEHGAGVAYLTFGEVEVRSEHFDYGVKVVSRKRFRGNVKPKTARTYE